MGREGLAAARGSGVVNLATGVVRAFGIGQVAANELGGGVAIVSVAELLQLCRGVWFRCIHDKPLEADWELDWGKEEVGGGVNASGRGISWVVAAGNVCDVDARSAARFAKRDV